VTTHGTVLVVDDEKNIRLSLQMVLEGEGHEVVVAESAEQALAMLGELSPDVVLLDIQLPGLDGHAALARIRALDAGLPVIMVSGHATVTDAVSATRAGAFDFIEKPLSRERVLVSVANALRERRRDAEVKALRADSASAMLGRSAVMERLRAQIAKVGPTRARVLVTGESGTGKELVARAIHDASDRAGAPFVKVNCAAIPDELIESTLFGHEKGAFTGAVARRRGEFERAHRGTLFLDEIGDMSLAAQAKVLRVLQTQELTRVGGEQSIPVDVRVVAATHRDLGAACRSGAFREDLFFRLAVVPIETPPLRLRREDVPLLAEAFLSTVCRENGFRGRRFEPSVLEALSAYEWPGNVRELRNLVERMAILSGEVISEQDVPDHIGERGGRTVDDASALAGQGTLRDFRDAAERGFIEARLRELGWNISRAAESLGLERTHLHKRMNALGIRRERSTGERGP
jgi:DNA-binding NtrC family response regulator